MTAVALEEKRNDSKEKTTTTKEKLTPILIWFTKCLGIRSASVIDIYSHNSN